jgi:hypothetical protein
MLNNNSYYLEFEFLSILILNSINQDAIIQTPPIGVTGPKYFNQGNPKTDLKARM